MLLLKRGDKGEAVKRIQTALAQRGFDIGKSGADGIFGADTERAVRAFQKQRGLKKVDGLAGKDTLTALGLDIDTAEPAVNVTNVDFTEDETTVPPIVATKIGEYVSLILKQHKELLDRSQVALNQFETTMTFASTKEARLDIFGALLGAVYDVGVGELIAAVSKAAGSTAGIVLSLAKSAYDQVTVELDRAGKASVSVTVGNWIKDQRTAIENARDKIIKPDVLQEEIALKYLESANRTRFFDELADINNRLNEDVLPSISKVELKMYEQWINAHFKGLGNDMPGCIEYRLEFDEEGFNFVACTVQAPFGDKVADALNQLLNSNLVSAKRPLDFNVRKRACFFVENMVPGGKSWDCGWLDQNNNAISTPALDKAEKAINDMAWRVSVKRFREED